MKEELDSQLSAMFDNELPPAQCELLARRLSRDEQLKARWGRYAAIGATIRAEGGARLNAEVARRVRAVLSNEPVLSQAASQSTPGLFAARWWRPVASGAVAASVAATAVLWLRFQSTPGSDPVVADALPSQSAGPVSGVTPGGRSQLAPDSYVVPKIAPVRAVVPSTQLANYVVAHSEFSSPVNRRNILSALMVNEAGTAVSPAGSDEPSEDVYEDAKTAQ